MEVTVKNTVSQGPKDAELLILIDRLSVAAEAEGKAWTGWEERLFSDALLEAGIPPSSVRILSLSATRQHPTEQDKEQARLEILRMPALKVIIPLGEAALKFACEKGGIDKWHLSPLDSIFPAVRAIPTYDRIRCVQEPKNTLYVRKAFARAKKALELPRRGWPVPRRNFLLHPKHEETFFVLERILREKPEISVDIETGRGQINTVGFAWSASDAIAINVLPATWGTSSFQKVWLLIQEILEDPEIPKIYQNFIYEAQRFLQYGIQIENTSHDTMICQKFLWPEFDMGLGEVGRFYTERPYWKDVGKTTGEEGKAKDWGNVRDWQAHYLYNCLDTSGTYEAAMGQREDLKSRGLLPVWDGYLRRLFPAVQEMCARGLPVSAETKERLTEETERRIAELMKELPEGLNPKSPKQKVEFFRGKGYRVPKKKNSKGKMAESADELSLKKLRLKHPEDKDIETILEINRLNKFLSSYLKFKYWEDGRMRFSLNAHGTETGRFSSGSDAWGRGMNAQTVPKNAKEIFELPPGRVFLQCDLQQAESRFVAYDAADHTLIEMLEDPTKDIHSFVAAEIFGVSPEQVRAEHYSGNSYKRQLGKKSGHGANYSMQGTTFQESCLKEMNLVLSKKEAENVLEGYHRLFPGIRRWHKRIRDEVSLKRRLTNPFGRERYFYGRLDWKTFGEAYAYRPQSTIPDITNSLMLHLLDLRREGAFDFSLLLQVHDSVVLDCSEEEAPKIAEVCLEHERWQPGIRLSAGVLQIPTDVEIGRNYGKLEAFRK